MVEVFHKACLIDGLQRAETHGDSWKLPEIRHQPGVRVGGETLSTDLLSEVVKIIFTQSSLEKGAGIDARSRVSLEKDQITRIIFSRGAPEVVETDIVECC